MFTCVPHKQKERMYNNIYKELLLIYTISCCLCGQKTLMEFEKENPRVKKHHIFIQCLLREERKKLYLINQNRRKKRKICNTCWTLVYKMIKKTYIANQKAFVDQYILKHSHFSRRTTIKTLQTQTHTQTDIYIYIYICVCVCVCGCVCVKVPTAGQGQRDKAVLPFDIWLHY